MGASLDAARRSRLVIAAATLAAVAVTAFALVGIAVLLGWIERPGRSASAPATAAAPAATPTPAPPTHPKGTSEVVLAPGETLVEPPGPVASSPEPLMPHYAPPRPPPPAPRGETPRLIEKPIPEGEPGAHAPPAIAESPAQEREPRSAFRDRPSRPTYSRREHPTSPFDRWPQPETCDECGVVTAVRSRRDLDEVRVRFDDGYILVVRYPPPVPWRAGDRVRLVDGRLLRD